MKGLTVAEYGVLKMIASPNSPTGINFLDGVEEQLAIKLEARGCLGSRWADIICPGCPHQTSAPHVHRESFVTELGFLALKLWPTIMEKQ